MKHFIDNYFERGPEIELPGIGEHVMLPRNVWYRYDGEVGSLVKNIARTKSIINGRISANQSRLEKILNWPVESMALESLASEIRKTLPGIDKDAAYCYRHQIDNRVSAYVIAKKSGLEKSKSIFADGHESGELLAKTGQRQLMQNYLEKDNIALNASLYEGEDYADIGGFLALTNAIKRGETGIRLPVFETRQQVLKVLAVPFGF